MLHLYNETVCVLGREGGDENVNQQAVSGSSKAQEHGSQGTATSKAAICTQWQSKLCGQSSFGFSKPEVEVLTRTFTAQRSRLLNGKTRDDGLGGR